MMSEMNGVDLSASELSYLLATLDAPEIVGFDATALFPKKKAAREAMFGQAREELEAHGWIKPIPDHPDEYELDAELLALVSIIASPSFVLATRRISGEQEDQVVLHYLADESIVEFSGAEAGTYRIGQVSDQGALFERIAAMLQCPSSTASKQFELDSEVFEHIQSLAMKGKLEQAQAELESAGVGAKMAGSIVSAVCNPAQGQIVLIRTDFGTVEAGRRVRVLGEGKHAWIVKRSSPDSTDVEMIASDAASVIDLLTVLLDELTH
jgi:hypothetical protein